MSEEKHAGGRPLAFDSVDELAERVELYFLTDAYISHGFDGDREIKQFAPTMSGLALFLGVDRKTLYNYSSRDEFFPTIKNARARVEVALEQHLYSKSVTGAIFSLKNNFDWTDKQELAHTSPDGSMSPRGRKLEDFYESDVPVKPSA